MKNTDGRKLSPELQQHNRKVAIKLFEQGVKRRVIATSLDVSYLIVCRWIRLWKKGGSDALTMGKRGRRPVEQRKLTEVQEGVLKEVLLNQNPEQNGLPYALWSRKAIQEVIWKMWRVRIAIRTISDYMKRWEFTPQKPLKRAYQQSRKQVQKWLDETYPAIKKKARQQNGEICWGDETGVKNQCQHHRGYAPKGKTPVVDVSSKRFSINMISSVSNRGDIRFMLYRDKMTAKILIKFMKRLIKDAGKKVFLILDNLKVHHAHVVQKWLAKHQDQIEVHYLPSYSPELNPDEYLNCDLKTGIKASSAAKSQSELEKKVIKHMRMLQKKPDRVIKYFEHRSIQYAA